MASVSPIDRRVATTILRRLHGDLPVAAPEARALAAQLDAKFLESLDRNALVRAAGLLEALVDLLRPRSGAWREIERVYLLLKSPEKAESFVTRFIATRPALEGLIEENGLGILAREIQAAAKPAILLVPTRQTAPPTLPFSRLGGLPQLPESLEWPTHEDRALTFLAQIQLSELGGLLEAFPECPRHGRLYFFCDVENYPSGWDRKEAGRWRVLFTADETEPVTEAPAPPELTAYELLHPVSVFAHRTMTIPATRSIELSRLPALEGDTWDRYLALRNDLSAGGPQHQLFGHPAAIQGCMQRTAQFASKGLKLPKGVHSWYEHPRAAKLMPGAHDWLLLLQVDSDSNVNGYCWGDAGTLYFWIQRDDLIHRRFGNAWCFMQCG